MCGYLKNSRQIEWVPRYQSDIEHLDIFFMNIFKCNNIWHNKKLISIEYLINVFKNPSVIDFDLSRTVGTRELFVSAHTISYNKMHVFYSF